MDNRFEGAVWYSKIQQISTTIVGLGATGSWASILLARAGVQKLNLVDPDHYEIHNLGSQLAGFQDIGVSKVQAASEKLATFTSLQRIQTYKQTIENVDALLQDYHAKVVISALDSMSGRKFIFEKMLENTNKKQLLLDSRIGAEYYEIYCIPMDNQQYIDQYRETLFSDEQGNVGACNYQQSSHSACMAACEMVKLVTNWITNEIMEDTDIPYKITHDLRTNSYGVY